MKPIHTVYAASMVIHVAGAVALNLVEPPKQVELVNVTMTTIEAQKKEEPKPKPPDPEPAAAPRPAPMAAPAEVPPDAAPPPPAPDFGFVMSGGGGPGGVAVGPKTPVPPPRQAVKKLGAAAVTIAPTDDCGEPEVKPKAIAMPHPAYTDEARAAAIEGKVRVQLALTAEGTVAEAKAIEGLGFGLDEAAVDSLKRATFSPATRCGKAVPATFTVAVRFAL